MASQFAATVPQGLASGQMFRIRTPTGQLFQISVPPGVKGGDRLLIDSHSGKVSFPRQQGHQQFSRGNNPQPRQQNNQIQPMMVVVPNNVRGGDMIKVRLPDGNLFPLQIPTHATPGSRVFIHPQTGQLLSNGSAITPIPQATPVFNQSAHPSLPVAQPIGDNKNDPEEQDMFSEMHAFPSWWTFRGHPHTPIPNGLRGGAVGLPNPRSTGRKKALLIGINYKGTRAALRGCVNDVNQMQSFLQRQGFENTPETMVCLIDSSRDGRFQPTKANIIKGMQWLVANAHSGDTLFFHFSGHGAQQTDHSGHEKDGLNETICPVDFNKKNVGMITDDQIWEIMVSRVPNGCRLYSLMDCCHCGTGMDLSFNWKNHSQWIQEPNPSFTEGDVILFSGCDDHQTSADAYNKLANAPGGAMTTSFINMFNQRGVQTMAQFIHNVHQDVRRRGFRQVPQLSSSQRWDPRARIFDFNDSFCSNQNPEIGKLVTQRFKPAKPDFGNSPLGPMLLAAGFAVFVAPSLIGAGADVVGGIFDGGGLFDGGLFDGGFF